MSGEAGPKMVSIPEELALALKELGQAMRDEDHTMRMFGESCSKAMETRPNDSLGKIAKDFQFHERLEEARMKKLKALVFIEQEARKMAGKR